MQRHLMAKHIHFKEVTSTNDVAFDFAQKGAEHLTCITADVQTKGRGRRGRVWSTVPSKSIAASFVIKGEQSNLLPFITSLATLETIQNFVPEAVIKWPNDILIHGKKASGILIEKHGHGGSCFYIIGIGINVLKFDKNFFDETIEATALEFYSQKEISIKSVLTSLQSSLQEWLKMPDVEVLNSYRKKCVTIGSYVTWIGDRNTLTGLAKSVTDSGSLILELDDGTTKEILSGDIVAQK
ncbi:MAG: biotin--[acetyl-CoA-carboxylase] ligase [Magnetococcales bacterium]|nr:biotin--[acetyl-CoA-carboxylase] ligase [Magnetococcales bacterium]